MHKTNLMATALALGLVACGTPGQRHDKDLMPRTPDACKVHVHLDNRDKIFVDQEPTRTGRCAGERKVNFFLVGAAHGATLEIAIKSGPRPAPVCKPVEGQPKQYICDFAGVPIGSNQQFQYTVSVIQGVDKITLDPMMIND